MAEMAEMGGTELIGGAKFENWLTLYCHLVIPCNTGLPFLSLTAYFHDPKDPLGSWVLWMTRVPVLVT